MRALRLAMVVVVLGSLAAACGGGSTTGGGGGATSPGNAVSSGSGSGSGSEGSPSPGAGTVVTQGAGGQLVFSPSSFSLKRGTRLILSNPGALQHTFTTADQELDLVNDPGQFQSVPIKLAPGTYAFVCRFHVAAGMRGTMTVTP
jgi:plastocyanin